MNADQCQLMRCVVNAAAGLLLLCAETHRQLRAQHLGGAAGVFSPPSLSGGARAERDGGAAERCEPGAGGAEETLAGQHTRA